MTLTVLLIICAGWNVLAEEDSEEPNKSSHPLLQQLLPSSDALEDIAVKILDALIKRGQIAMAKSAFNTQLEVLKKVQPEQYKKYKKVPVEQLAAEAVMQQAEMARLEPKTGNKLIDMLHENGIPIGNSLKGLEQAIKTQREIENTNPTEQIAKAILEKVQKQILPGVVANVIAGRNPFQLGAAREEVRALSDPSAEARRMRQQQEEALKALQDEQLKQVPNAQSMQYDLNPTLLKQHRRSHKQKKSKDQDRRSGQRRFRKKSPSTASELVRRRVSKSKRPALLLLAKREEDDRQRDIPLADKKEQEWKVKEKQREVLPMKEALVLGLHSYADEDSHYRNPHKFQAKERRLAPPKLPRHIKRNLEFRRRKTGYGGLDDDESNDESIEKYAQPRRIVNNPEPQVGYSIPRPIPQRPRIMLPLTIGVEQTDDDLEEMTAREPFAPEEVSTNRRRHPAQRSIWRNPEVSSSRVLDNLRNNPALAGIFDNEALVERLSRPSVLSAAQRAGTGARGNYITTYPRLAATSRTRKALLKPIDYKVKQIVEERPIPPPLFIPKGRHTRIRLTGATEKEIPGLGGRFVIPSFDPTLPALNTAVHTQGRQRDEYDSMMKLPNRWQGGDTFGLHTKTRTERLFGGNGMVDTPAIGKYTSIG